MSVGAICRIMLHPKIYFADIPGADPGFGVGGAEIGYGQTDGRYQVHYLSIIIRISDIMFCK